MAFQPPKKEWSDGAKKKLRALGVVDEVVDGSAAGLRSSMDEGNVPVDATVANIESLYKERISELKKQITEAKKSAKEQKVCATITSMYGRWKVVAITRS